MSLPAAHNNLGLLATEQGRPERAIRHCREAGCSPDDALHNAMLNQRSTMPGTATLDPVSSVE